MKILYLLSQRPDSTGSGVYLRALMREARRHGDEVEALVGVNEPHEAGDCRYYVHFGRDLPYPVVGMSDVMPYPSTRWSDLPDLAQYRRVFSERLEQAVHEFEPDVIHGNHLWVLTSLARGPVLATCHGSCLRQAQLNPHLRPDLSRVMISLALSKPQRRSIQQEYGRNSVVLGPGYDSDLFRWGDGPRVGVLYAGKLSVAKGVRELLDAWDGPLRLAGGGSGDEADALRERAGSRCLGILSPQELAQEMRAARVFCLPSYWEGAPLVVVEAVACGCRVVVNDLPGLRGWVCKRWLEEGRVVLVKLPPRIGPDVPDPAHLPAYRQRLREALETAVASEVLPPAEGGDSYRWERVYAALRGLYTKISRA